MAISDYVGGELDKDVNTFEDWLNKTNSIVTDLGSRVVSAELSANGAVTSGNVVIDGFLEANVLAIGSELRGGTLSNTSLLTISSDVDFTGLNITANVETFSLDSNTYVVDSEFTTFSGGTTTFNSTDTIVNSNETRFNSTFTYFDGTLTTISSNTVVTAETLTISGNTSLTANGFTVTTISATTIGAATINVDNLTVNDSLNITANTSITGNIDITGDMDISGQSSFTGDVSIIGDLTVSGNTNFDTGAITTFDDTVIFNGAVIGISASDVNVTDTTTSSNTFYPTFVATFGANTIIRGASTKLYFTPSTGQLNATNFNSLSDQKFKDNIITLDHDEASDVVEKLNPVSFIWKETGEKSYGLIAQELEKIIPEAVHTSEDNIKSVSYNQIISFLISTVQKQQKEIDKIKSILG